MSFLKGLHPKTNSLATAANQPRFSPAWRRLIALLAVAAAYVGAARLGLLVATMHGNVSPVWPATGLAIGCLLTGGVRLWPGVLLGAFLANAVTPVPILTAVGIGVGNTLEAIVGAWLVTRLGASLRRWELEHLDEPVAYAVSAAAAPVVSATVGTLSLLAGGAITTDLIPTLWVTWWVGDALGALLIAPLLVALAGALPKVRIPTLQTLGKVAGVALAGFGACALVFFLNRGSAFLFAVFPALLLAMIWFGPVGARLTALGISVLSIAAAFHGSGPFTDGLLNENLISLQLFLMSVTATALVLPVFRTASSMLLPTVLLLVGWGLFGWLFHSLDRDRLREDAANFDSRILEAVNRIERRLRGCEDSLRAGGGLFNGSRLVDRAVWRGYVEALRLPERYPGIAGIAAVLPVSPDQADAFTARMRADGVPDFAIKPVPQTPPVVSQGEQFVVACIEPLATNRPALGLDLASEANRRTAAEQSRDSGEPYISQPIRLVQGNSLGPGFLFFVPIYRQGLPGDTVAQRRAALVGWVNAVFLTKTFMDDALGGMAAELELQIYEGPAMSPEHLLYHSPGTTDRPSRFERVTNLSLGGQNFCLAWNRGPMFVGRDASPALWAATSSALMSLFLVGLVVSFRSVGERARLIVERRTQELAASEEKFRSMAQSASSAIISADAAGRIIAWNLSAEKMFGRSAAKAIGQPMNLIMPARHRAAHEASLPPLQRGEASRVIGRTVELQGLRKDGCEFPLELSLSTWQQGGEVYFTGIIQDISARKEAEEKLRQTIEKLERSNIDLERFAYVASHDLQEPFRAIAGCVQILEKNYRNKLDAKAEELIRHTVEGVLRMQRLIEDLLAFSRFVQHPATFAQTDLEHVLTEVLRNLETSIAQSGAVITHDALPTLNADAAQCLQLFQNLLANAIKFRSPRPLAIHISARCQGAFWQFAIRDNGIGIHPQYFDRIFILFQRLHTRYDYSGTGVGLAICKKIAEGHGGRIWVESSPDEGATFLFTLPSP